MSQELPPIVYETYDSAGNVVMQSYFPPLLCFLARLDAIYAARLRRDWRLAIDLTECLLDELERSVRDNLCSKHLLANMKEFVPRLLGVRKLTPEQEFLRG